jgi:hypothetical protein
MTHTQAFSHVNADRGVVCFYQCEFPYGVDREFVKKEFRGYIVGESVTDHQVVAPGIYSNFRNEAILVATAVEHPARDQIRVVNPFAVKLDNGGGILSVLNGVGEQATTQGVPARVS